MMRASAAIERCGIPTTSILITGYINQGRLVSRSQGMKNLTISEYPDTMMTDTYEEMSQKVCTVVCNAVVKNLTQPPKPLPDPTAGLREPEKQDIIFRGDLENVQAFFHKNMWTDGLPIVPPTLDRIERFLAFTNRNPDEIIAIFPHEKRELTIWNVAVNGVMAGCKPEYMPILTAIADAMNDRGDPNDQFHNSGFRPMDIGTSPGWEPLVIVSGPIARELNFNSGQGILRFGHQSNSTIGRFVKLICINVGGFRIPPGTGDKGSLGQPTNVAIAENEEFARQIGWPTFSMDKGFGPEENVVTVMSSAYISAPCYSGGGTGLEHLQTLENEIGRQSFGLYCTWGPQYGHFEPLLIIAPPVAEKLASDGWTKDKIRQHFFDNVFVTAGYMLKHWREFNGVYFDFEDQVKKGYLPPWYHESDDPQRPIHVLMKPEDLQIMIGGDPARNQSKGITQSGHIGVPCSRKIQLPSNWKELRKKYR